MRSMGMLALWTALVWPLGACGGETFPAPLDQPEPPMAATTRFAKRIPPDVSQIPFDKIVGPHRDRVIEILQKPVSWSTGRQEMFPCDRSLLEWMIDHPQVAGEFWKKLGISITDVELIDGGYICRDPSGAKVTFHVACDEPNLRICYCIGEAPAGVIPVKMHAELVIVHQFDFKEFAGAGTYVVQRLDGFATATGPALKLAMKLAPGQAERMVESCVQEMKVFFSVMCRLIQLRPHWSLEQLPALAATMTTQQKDELEMILKALPPTRQPIVVRRTATQDPPPKIAQESSQRSLE